MALVFGDAAGLRFILAGDLCAAEPRGDSLDHGKAFSVRENASITHGLGEFVDRLVCDADGGDTETQFVRRAVGSLSRAAEVPRRWKKPSAA